MSVTREGNFFSIGGFEIDIVVHGYPGKSVCHGGMGFSTIVLVRWEDRLAIVDVGSFGQRYLLREQLEARELSPDDVTDVLLTHSHYDHSINWTLFKHANIVISRKELEWAVDEPWGETVVPELYVRELLTWPAVRMVEDGDEVFPNIIAHITPGHTPGSTVFVLDACERDVVFTGDACKNRAELLSRAADMSYDHQVSKASIEAIWAFWSRKSGSVLVPGHDLPMMLDDGVPRYLGNREAAIRAWFGDSLNETTVISLLSDGGVSSRDMSE